MRKPWGQPSSRGGDTENHAGWVIGIKLIGSVDRIGGRIRITFHLLNSESGEQIWADEFRCAESGSELLLIRNELPRRIAATFAEERGVIQKYEQNSPREKGSKWSKAYRAVLLGYHFEQAMSLEALLDALEALSEAVEVDPECGQA